MKLKFKGILSLITAFVMVLSSFGMAFANGDGRPVDAVSSATDKGYTVDNDKVTSHDITIKHGIATYKMSVKIYKYGNVCYYIQDKTQNAPGYLGNIWEEFKAEDGLKKYVGLTFDEIKKMPRPAPKVIMGASDETPGEVHDAILKLIGELEKKDEIKAQKNKTALAKLFLSKLNIYAQRDDSEYDESSMKEFIEAYEKAERVLMKNNPGDSEIKTALNDLDDAATYLRKKPLDYTKLKKLVKEAEDIVAHEAEYSALSIAYLKQILGEANNVLDIGAKNKEALKKLEEKLEKVIKNAEKKASQGKMFNIRGKLAQAGDPDTTSMANGFMNPLITLEEKDGKAIYTIGFKKGGFQGITSQVEYLKHIENGKEIKAQELPGTGEYNKLFRITRSKQGEGRIDLKIAAKMVGPDIQEMPVLLVLDLTSKRPEGEVGTKADKTKLKAAIDGEKETFDDVNAGVYKPVGAAEYLKKYNKALKVLEDPDATQETVDKATRDLLNSKNLDLSLNKDKFAALIGKAEEMEKHPEKYTKESFARLKEAIKKANQNFYKTDMTKHTMAAYMKELQDVMDSLNPAGTYFEKTLKEGDISAKGMFTEDSKLAVKKDITDKLTAEQKKELAKLANVEKTVGSYDIAIENGTSKGKVNLTFNVGKDIDDRDVKITHFKKDGSVETFDKKVKDGTVTVETDSFSPFVISLIGKVDPNKPNPNKPNPNKPEIKQPKEKDKDGKTSDGNISKDKSGDKGNMAKDKQKETKKKNDTKPKTGDSKNLIGLIAAMLSAIGLALAVRRKKSDK